MRVHVCIPYNGEPLERLDMTWQSAIAVGPAMVHVANDYRHSLPHTLNRAAMRACETGATHIMWLSAGDVLLPNRLLTPPPDDRGEFCLVRVHSRGKVIPDPEEYEPGKLYGDNQFCLTGAIVPAHIWQELGGLDEDLTYCSDWDLAVRVQHLCGWRMVPIVCAEATEYEEGLSKGADHVIRNRDRARVSKMARELRG